MKIAVAGKNYVAINAVLFIMQKGFGKDSLLVCTNKTDLGEDHWQPSFKKFAISNGIEIVALEDLYDLENLIFFSLEFDRLIKPDKFKSKQLFNVHFSLLPSYKGMYTSCLPLVFGEKQSGVTFHFIDNGIDTGDIIDQDVIEIPLSLSGRKLYELYMKQGLVLFKRVFDQIISGKPNSKKQPILGSTYFSKAYLNFTKIQINFNQTAFQVHNQIRAFVFRPYQLPKIDGISIVHSSITSQNSKAKPGVLEKEDAYSRTYSTIDYDIVVYFDRLEEILSVSEKNEVGKMERFLEMGYDLNDKNDLGWDPLIVASFHGAYETVRFLVENGCDVNSTNYNGTSVLMYAMSEASKSGDIKVMEYLIRNGGDLMHKDNKEVSLLEYGIAQGNSVVIEFIESYL